MRDGCEVVVDLLPGAVLAWWFWLTECVRHGDYTWELFKDEESKQ